MIHLPDHSLIEDESKHITADVKFSIRRPAETQTHNTGINVTVKDTSPCN